MNYEQNISRKNLEAYRTIGTYYGAPKCLEMKGLSSLAVGSMYNNNVVEGFDYGNCQVVVPTEASMSYNKIFNRPVDSKSYRGYYNVPDGYYPGQQACGSYRMRNCQ